MIVFLLCDIKKRFSTTAKHQVLPQMKGSVQPALNCFLTLLLGWGGGRIQTPPWTGSSFLLRKIFFFYFFLLRFNGSSQGFIQDAIWCPHHIVTTVSFRRTGLVSLVLRFAHSGFFRGVANTLVLHRLLSQLCDGADEVGHNRIFIIFFCPIGPSVCTHLTASLVLLAMA